MPCCQRLAGERMAERPRKHLREQGQHGRGPGRGCARSWPRPASAGAARRAARPADRRPAGRPRVDHRHGRAVERQAEHGGRRRPRSRSGRRRRSCPARRTLPSARAVAALGRQAFEVGVIELVRVRAAGRAARGHVQTRAPAAPRPRPVVDAARLGPARRPRRADDLQLEAALPALVIERAVGRDVRRAAR